jgi:formate hydrogenlyase subunit 4
VFILAIMLEFPGRNDGLARVSSVVTTTKLISLFVTVVLLLFLLVRWVVGRRRAPASA